MPCAVPGFALRSSRTVRQSLGPPFVGLVPPSRFTAPQALSASCVRSVRQFPVVRLWDLLRSWRLFEASHLEGFREFEDRVGWCLTDRDRGWISCGRRFSATSDWIGLWMGSCDGLSAFRQRIGSSNGAGNFDGRVATALSAARG